MHVALNGLWISPYIYVYVLRNHGTLCNNSSKKLVSKCPSLCFLCLPPRSMVEPGPQKSRAWTHAQLNIDFAKIEGYITRIRNAEQKFCFGRFFLVMKGGKGDSKDIFKVQNCVCLQDLQKKKKIRKRKEDNKIREGS